MTLPWYAMAVAALRWFQAALFCQIVLLFTWVTTEVVDLFPWNDLVSRPLTYDLNQSIAVNVLPQLAFIGIFALGVRWIAVLPAMGYAVYLIVQLWIWWVPYAIGADPEWQAFYTEAFARTINVLPSSGVHLAPDVQHLALQALTILALMVTAKAATLIRHL